MYRGHVPKSSTPEPGHCNVTVQDSDLQGCMSGTLCMVSKPSMCRCAAGAELDATKVLDALSEDMPLAVAVDIIARMLRTAMHARRSGSIVRNLQRSLHLSTAAERAEVRVFLHSLHPRHQPCSHGGFTGSEQVAAAMCPAGAL